MASVWAARNFDDRADLTPLIYGTLNSARPEHTIRDLWDWVPPSEAQRFLDEAMPLQNAGNGDLEVVVLRFQHTIRALHHDRYARGQKPAARWWQGLFGRADMVGWLFALLPTAGLLTAIEVWK